MCLKMFRSWSDLVKSGPTKVRKFSVDRVQQKLFEFWNSGLGWFVTVSLVKRGLMFRLLMGIIARRQTREGYGEGVLQGLLKGS